MSQIVFIEWWVCLRAYSQSGGHVLGRVCRWWAFLHGGGSVSGHVRMVVDVSQVMFA